MNKATVMAILRLPGVQAAHRALRGQDAANKLAAAEWLAERIEAGSMSMDDIRAAASAPAPTAAVDEAKVAGNIRAQVEGQITDRMALAESRVLARLDSTEARLSQVADTIAAQAAELRIRVDAIRVDDDAVKAQVAESVAQAFGPFAQAVKAAQAEAVIGQMVSATVVARVPCLQAFGVDLRDRKGQPVMVDVWNHADAPAVDPLFIWTESILRALLLNQDGGKIWMGGPKGTGKTQTAEQFAARTGRRFVRFNFRKYTSAEDYIGATGLDGGSTTFKPGPVLVGLTTPGTMVLLDELTNCDPGEAAPLNGLLEPAGSVSIGGRVWSVAPGVMVLAADNTLGNGDDSGRYAGTRTMNSSLLDRFPLVIRMDYLDPTLEEAAIRSHTGCDPKLAAHVVQAIRICRERVATGDVVDAPSLRAAVAFVNALRLMPVPEAWAAAVANRQPTEGAAGLEAVFTACINQSLVDSLI